MWIIFSIMNLGQLELKLGMDKFSPLNLSNNLLTSRSPNPTFGYGGGVCSALTLPIISFQNFGLKTYDGLNYLGNLNLGLPLNYGVLGIKPLIPTPVVISDNYIN
jgi:hypothetical protein